MSFWPSYVELLISPHSFRYEHHNLQDRRWQLYITNSGLTVVNCVIHGLCSKQRKVRLMTAQVHCLMLLSQHDILWWFRRSVPYSTVLNVVFVKCEVGLNMTSAHNKVKDCCYARMHICRDRHYNIYILSFLCQPWSVLAWFLAGNVNECTYALQHNRFVFLDYNK